MSLIIMDTAIVELGKILARRYETDSSIVFSNFQIGKIVSEVCKDHGETAIPEIAKNLALGGVGVSQEFLFTAKRVYAKLGDNGKLITLRNALHKNLFNWSFICSKYNSIPEGDSEEAKLYWERVLAKTERTLGDLNDLATGKHELPENVRMQAGGLLNALGFQGKRKIQKILHMGDQHFEDNDLLEDVSKSAQTIVAMAREESPDLIISSGDMVNSRLTHDSEALQRCFAFVRQLAAIAPVFILRGTASHDGLSIKLLEHLDTRYPVYVSESIEQVGYSEGRFCPIEGYVEGLDALIYALPPVSKGQLLANPVVSSAEAAVNVIDMLRDVFKSWGVMSDQARVDQVPTIVSGHGTAIGAVTSTGQKMIGRDLEFGLSDLALIKADIVCLDHIHKAQQLGRNVFYSGSIAKLNSGESEDKGVYYHEFTEDGVESRFMVIPTKDIIEVEYEGIPNIEELPMITPGALVKISYTIKKEDAHTFNQKEFEKHLLSLGASKVKIGKTVIDVQDVRTPGISKKRNLLDKFTMWGEYAGIEITDSRKEKIELLEQPVDSVCQELGIKPPKRSK